MSSLDYASSDDPLSYRPVYLLVFGNKNDTRTFVKSYQKKLPESAQTNVAIFSSDIGIDTILEADKVNSKKKIIRIKQPRWQLFLTYFLKVILCNIA